jgi:acetate kinase
MKILVLNFGSSSLKYKLFAMETGGLLASGQADRIGLSNARFRYEAAGQKVRETAMDLPDHSRAVHALLSVLTDSVQGVLSDILEIAGVGHRVVHGGEHFRTSVVVDSTVRKTLETTNNLAPLHNPPNLMGIDVCAKLMPGVPQVAVFDTAFHANMPPYAYTYAIPYRYYSEDAVRRYGFHGTSHRYVASRAADLLKQKIEAPRIITCHLGAGSSLCAVVGGRSMDTSMGFTPLSGLVMATRSGDMDPAVVSFIMDKESCSIAQAIDILNRQSGVFGISGISPDFRDLKREADAGHERARLALDVFAYSVARGVGSLIPAIGGLDALVFTAGIGENAPAMRSQICGFLTWLGISLDEEKNHADGAKEKIISAADSGVCVLVTPTDEEQLIARETRAVLQKQ